MTVPNNILQVVQTYQESGLAYLQNLNCFISTFNKKFKDFEKKTANLGDTVGFDLPTRFTSTDNLVAQFQPADQRIHTLTVDQQISVSYAFTAQQFVFQVHDYMKQFGKGAQEELAAKVESNVALNCVTQPYRFYGDGKTPIQSYLQLANMIAQYRNYGSPKGELKAYMSDVSIPAIINQGQNQFTLNRGNETANSWELGRWDNCEFMTSNLLPIHIAGTAGQDDLTLTVVSTTLDSAGAVIEITFSVSGAPGVDADMVKLYDKFQFQDGVSGHENLRFRTFIGHNIAAVPVQFRATANAASGGGSTVSVAIYPPLQANANNSQNISAPIVAGLQAKVLPSHRAGMLLSGDAGYLAMPALPDEVPYPTANMVDPETGCSFRQYYGSVFGQNTRGMIHDCIWGSTVVPEYSMGIIFPI